VTNSPPTTLTSTELNLDLLSGLSPEEVCERSESDVCEKCGARQDQGCQLEEPRGPSTTERAYGEMWGQWADGMAKQLGIDNE
jgi:hypothetical protein